MDSTVLLISRLFVCFQAPRAKAIPVFIQDDLHLPAVKPDLFTPAVGITLAGEEPPACRTALQGSFGLGHRVSTTVNLLIWPPRVGLCLETLTVTDVIWSDAA